MAEESINCVCVCVCKIIQNLYQADTLFHNLLEYWQMQKKDEALFMLRCTSCSLHFYLPEIGCWRGNKAALGFVTSWQFPGDACGEVCLAPGRVTNAMIFY